MRTLTGIMSQKSKIEYLESCRARYPSRNRVGKSAMIDQVSDTLGWARKHTIKALNGKVSLGQGTRKRGSKATYSEDEKRVIVEIWKRSEQPCGKLLKPTIPLWLASYETRHGSLSAETRRKVQQCSPRQLDRITAPHKLGDAGRHGRSTGRTSHRLKSSIAVRCGPWEVDRPGWLEVDTVSHGGGSSSGEFMWSLTLTDIHTGWTELAGLWGNSGREVCVGLRRIEARLPFEMLGFDCDNGSEFLNTVVENHLLGQGRPPKWTRSRAYKKNDQAHVEQKNFTHVRQLLGYGRFDDLQLVEMVNDLYENAWLPMRNLFTPTMKLIEKKRVGSKVRKTYDSPQTPCDRMLTCGHVSAETKQGLRASRAAIDPLALSDLIESKLVAIQRIVEEIEERRAEERWRAGEPMGSIPPAATAGGGCVTALVAIAPDAFTPPPPAEVLAKFTTKSHKTNQVRVS
jgi:hypothetical protein